MLFWTHFFSLFWKCVHRDWAQVQQSYTMFSSVACHALKICGAQFYDRCVWKSAYTSVGTQCFCKIFNVSLGHVGMNAKLLNTDECRLRIVVIISVSNRVSKSDGVVKMPSNSFRFPRNKNVTVEDFIIISTRQCFVYQMKLAKNQQRES